MFSHFYLLRYVCLVVIPVNGSVLVMVFLLCPYDLWSVEHKNWMVEGLDFAVGSLK